MGPGLRVRVVGQVTHDRDQDGIVPGGCAFYGARCYRTLGADVHLCTSVGHDFRFERSLALDEVSVSWQRGGETTVFSNHYPVGQIRVQCVQAVAPPIVAAPLLGAPADLVHLAPVMGDVDLASWKASSGEGLLAMSVQGWIKRPGPVIEGDGPVVQSVVPHRWDVSAAELSGIGAACLSDEDLVGQGDLLRRLCAAVPIVALTHGDEGSHVIVRGRSRRVGVYPTTPRDLTGAGDAYAAGFFHELARGQDPVTAARLGAAVASIIVEGRGAGPIDRRTALERMPRIPVD